MNKHLSELVQYQAKTWNFKGVSALLGWDSKTYMPADGIGGRSQQLSLVEGLIHQRITASEYKTLLGRLIDLDTGGILEPSLSLKEQRLAKESLRDYRLALSLPNSFVEQFTAAATQSEHSWEQAKIQNDYSLFAPHLKKMIELSKQKAAYFALGATPYDSLLNLYEPYATTQEVDRVFRDLKRETIGLLAKLPNPAPKPAFLTADFAEAKLLKLAKELMKKMGAAETRIRLDLSAHPFCTTIHPSDIRITARFGGLDQFFLSILHETGHALYEADLPQEWYGSPLCEAMSMGIHESQSRFWEVFVGKSRAFWQGQLPILQDAFPEQLKGITLEEFYRAITTMGPGLIRVAADELTYNLHIIIRFELEQLMINGSVDVSELPGMWKAKYRQYLGVEPQTDSEGILQDPHWSFGDFGYFPTYTLGNLYAAHWWEQIQKEIPTIDELIRAQNFQPILQWLSEKIHTVGRGQSSSELVRSITGSELSCRPLVSLLKNRIGLERS